MSIEVVAQGVVEAPAGRLPLPPVVVLGRREGRRMLTSPVYALMLLLVVTMGGLQSVSGDLLGELLSAENVYGGVSYFLLLYAGVLTYAAAHLVTSSARRARAEAGLAASPLGSRGRGAGLCLGVVLGPGLVAVALALVLAVIGADLVIVGNDGALSGAELAQLPLLVVGGGLFGVLTATWLRFPGSLPLGLVVLVFGTGVLAASDSTTVPWLAPYTSAEDWWDAAWAGTGSHAWHAVYLAGLCGLAACGVMLHEPEGRRRWLAVSAVVLAATAAAGAAQL